MFAKSNLWVAIALSLVLSACGDKDSPEQQAKASLASVSDSELLTYVPSDTPYFFGSLEQFPPDLIEKMKPLTESMMHSYAELLRGLLASPDAFEGNAASVRPFIELLVEEMSDDKEYIFGLGYDSRVAVYGHGLLPVMRATLDDVKHYDGLIARLEARDDVELLSGSANGQDYRYIGADTARIMFARDGEQLIVTAAPPGATEDVIATLLGADKPASSLADTGRVSQLVSKYNYLSAYVGFMDLQTLVATFTEAPTGINKVLFDSMDEEREMLSDVCKTEIAGLASAMPELNFGYTYADDERIDASFVLEVREDLATGMQSIPAPVPGVGGDLGGLGFMSFGLDINAAKEFLGARAEAIAANPYECEELSGLNDSAAQLQASLGTPLPPFVTNFRGVALIVDRIGDLDLAGGKPPEDIDARIVVALDDAPSMLMMGQMMVPQLGALNLEPTGEATEMPPGLIPGMTQPTFIALAENGVSLGIGEASKDLIGDMLTADLPEDAPLQTFGYDYGAYMKFIGDTVAAAGESDPQWDQSQQILQELSEAMDRAIVSFHMTENGVEFDTTITLK